MPDVTEIAARHEMTHINQYDNQGQSFSCNQHQILKNNFVHG